MKKKLLGKCPVCGENLFVSELKCKECCTKISGEFELSKFDYLTDDEQKFALVFIKNAGNITSIEKELDISYPTVKKYLELVQSKLGLNTENRGFNYSREDILGMLKNNEITFEQAEEYLKDLGD